MVWKFTERLNLLQVIKTKISRPSIAKSNLANSIAELEPLQIVVATKLCVIYLANYLKWIETKYSNLYELPRNTFESTVNM